MGSESNYRAIPQNFPQFDSDPNCFHTLYPKSNWGQSRIV
ncbi:hypothetical protein MASSI9I_50471 [Massilia sp. 9I]|nr:hypothetical protein MASSI9I_50471 [Massilia sp. 9I]